MSVTFIYNSFYKKNLGVVTVIDNCGTKTLNNFLEYKT